MVQVAADVVPANEPLRRANLRGANMAEAYLENADLLGADLREVRGLTTDQLMGAKNWERAYRDADLACGAPIPTPPDEQGTE